MQHGLLVREERYVAVRKSEPAVPRGVFGQDHPFVFFVLYEHTDTRNTLYIRNWPTLTIRQSGANELQY